MANSGGRGFGRGRSGAFVGGVEPLQAVRRDDQSAPSGTSDQGGRSQKQRDRDVGPSGKSDQYRAFNEGSLGNVGAKPDSPRAVAPADPTPAVEAIRQIAEVDPVEALRVARTEFLKAMQTLDEVIEKYSKK